MSCGLSKPKDKRDVSRRFELLPVYDVADRTATVLEEDFAEAKPIPRVGKPEDIAQAAAWLASDASTFVNGRDLVVDRGHLVGLPLPMVLSSGSWSPPR